MRPVLSGNVILFLLMLFAQELMGKRNKERHNREANKKSAPAKECVADYCLPLEYNPLELPSSERQDVQINLEVSTSNVTTYYKYISTVQIIFTG